MGVLDSSYIKAMGVKSAGLNKIFLIFQDTLIGIDKNRLITPFLTLWDHLENWTSIAPTSPQHLQLRLI